MHHLRNACLAGVTLAALLAPAWAQNWTDRHEYDLVLNFREEADPARKLALIAEWKQKYPASQYARVRAEMALQASESLGDSTQMLASAKELLAADGNSFLGLYWLCVLGPGQKASPSDQVGQIDAAAKKLLAAKEGQSQRAHVDFVAHRALGWAAWQHDSFDTAAREFQLALEKAPQEAEVSAWLGAVLALQNTPETKKMALWYLARASYLGGDGALTNASQRGVRDLLDGYYTRYHGSAEGLDELGAAAKAAAAPPADFRIESADEARIRKKDEELIRGNPDLAPWLKLKHSLEAPNAEAYLQTLSTAPPTHLKGLVVRCALPGDIGIAMDDPAAASAILNLDAPFPNCAEPGTPVEFDGIPQSFTASPFTVTFSVKREQVTGWPPPARKGR
jgi:hypothetical protein